MTIPQAFELALQHHRAGRLSDAEALYRQILTVQPKHAEASRLLGVIAQRVGRHDLAVDLICRAIFLNPNNPAAHSNLGEAYHNLGRLDEAIAAFHRAIELKRDFPESHYNLGVALRERGRLDEAVAACSRAIELKPDFPEAHNNLGVALRERGQLDEAVAACRRAIELKPNFPEAHNNLGIALTERRQLDAAVAACRRALEFKPSFPEAHNNLANALRDQGQLHAAVVAYRHALELKPEHAGTHSNLVFALHFHPGHDAMTISEEHRRWNRQFSDPLKQFLQPHANDRNLERRLRIGYVSPDFWDHAVGRCVLPLFEHHDRGRFDILCYSGVARPDWMTERIRALTGLARNASPPASLREPLRIGRSDEGGGWRNTVGVSDARLAEMIREDGVDILSCIRDLKAPAASAYSRPLVSIRG
jgi:protein O-GlcNAc transferase